MMEIIRENEKDKIIEIIIDGKISTESMETLSARIERLAKEWGTINVLEKYITMDSISYAAIKKDLRMYFKNRKSFNKVAVLSDKFWIKTITFLLSPFYRVEIKSFRLNDIDIARRWLAC